MSDPMGWIAAELGRLETEGLRRRPVTLSSPPGAEVVIGGRRVLQLCSNDYLGLAGDPRLRRAAQGAALGWGAGTGASRLVSGTGELHRALEADLARYKGCEDAILFSSGYLANLGAIAALAGREDAVFSDELNHASIVDGCRLSRARVAVYRHADPGDLDRLLAEVPARRRLVVTDTVFSMDGDVAPLGAIAEVCDRRGAMLMVDEAHATGLLGSRGRGAVEAAGLTGRVGVVMATLSKALGSAGGFVAGSHDLVEWLRNRARTYVFDTAPPPAAIGAAGEALRIAGTEPHRRARVLEAAAALAEGLASLGYRVLPPAAAIVPVVAGEGAEAMALSNRLLEAGVFVPAIRPPSVPPGTARLRVTLTAEHTEEHAERALDAFASVRPLVRGPVGSDVRPRLRPLGHGAAPLAGGLARGPRPLGHGAAPLAGGLARGPRPLGHGAAPLVGGLARASRAPDARWPDESPPGTPAPAERTEQSGPDPRILRAGGLFVTGTGTGVGKTVIAAAVARTLGAAGRRVGAMKSVQTGAAEGADDLAFLRAAAGVPAARCAAPYVMGPPLAPAVCARMAGERIDVAAIRAAFRALRERCDLVVVEGAGGLLVPLDGATTMAELAGALGLPVLVVALPWLGTLNHTALTIEAARARGLEVIGVALSRFPVLPGPAEATNPVEIERLTGVELVGAVPELNGLDVDRGVAPERFEAGDWLAPGLGGRFDRTAFLAGLAAPRLTSGGSQLLAPSGHGREGAATPPEPPWAPHRAVGAAR